MKIVQCHPSGRLGCERTVACTHDLKVQVDRSPVTWLILVLQLNLTMLFH